MGEGAAISRDDLPAAFVRFIEAIARGFQVDDGLANVKLTFNGGVFQAAWLESRIQTGDLTRFQKSWDEAFDVLLAEALTPSPTS